VPLFSKQSEVTTQITKTTLHFIFDVVPRIVTYRNGNIQGGNAVDGEASCNVGSEENMLKAKRSYFAGGKKKAKRQLKVLGTPDSVTLYGSERTSRPQHYVRHSQNNFLGTHGSTLKMEAKCSSEKLVLRCENLKSHVNNLFCIKSVHFSPTSASTTQEVYVTVCLVNCL
jgi:hypothetical protein